MRYVQLIFSPTGGTRKAAEIVSGEWSRKVETVDLSEANHDFSVHSFQKEDLILIALPSYGGRVPALAAERLSKIYGNGAGCVLLCVYGNRAYEDTLVEMEDLAEKSGFTVIAAIAAVAEHSILHQFAAGRPDKEDMHRLKSYGKAILDKLSDGGEYKRPDIPGNRPYKEVRLSGLVPAAAKKCTGCGLCMEKCPAQAISPENIRSADAKKCISCMRCIAVCPHSARRVNGVMTAAASLAMKKACSLRKDCELFI